MAQMIWASILYGPLLLICRATVIRQSPSSATTEWHWEPRSNNICHTQALHSLAPKRAVAVFEKKMWAGERRLTSVQHPSRKTFGHWSAFWSLPASSFLSFLSPLLSHWNIPSLAHSIALVSERALVVAVSVLTRILFFSSPSISLLVTLHSVGDCYFSNLLPVVLLSSACTPSTPKLGKTELWGDSSVFNLPFVCVLRRPL